VCGPIAKQFASSHNNYNAKRVATNLLSFLQHQKTGPFTFYRAFQLPEVGSWALETSSPNTVDNAAMQNRRCCVALNMTSYFHASCALFGTAWTQRQESSRGQAPRDPE